MSDIRTILNTIQNSIDKFSGNVGNKQETLFKQIVELTKDLETKNGALVNNVKNLKKINQLKIKIEKLIIDPKYKKDLKEFVQSYNDIQDLHNEYFSKINAQFGTFKGLGVLKNTAIDATLNSLTETGIDANITGPLKKMLLTNTQAGGSYADLTEQLRGFMLGKENQPGALEQYTKTYATTAINQFSAEYNKAIADDLGLEWYVYTGSLLTTSRPFCIKAVDKQYIHISEFATILHGDFGSFGKVHVNKKTGLPYGLMDGTTPENFPRRRGGWNCGHQLIAVDEIIVPQNVKDAVYATAAYKAWAEKNGKEIKKPAEKVEKNEQQTNFFSSRQQDIKKSFSDELLKKASAKVGLNYEEIVNVTGGIPKDNVTRIRHNLEVQGPMVKSSMESDQYSITRYIYDDKHIYNAYMRVFDTGQGIGLNLFTNQVAEARKQGFKYLEVSAEGNYEINDGWNGYITWAKFGYSMDEYSQSRFQSLMKLHERSEKNVFDLVSTKEGHDFWNRKGFSWHGYFHLDDNSAEMKNLKKYLADRKIQITL